VVLSLSAQDENHLFECLQAEKVMPFPTRICRPTQSCKPLIISFTACLLYLSSYIEDEYDDMAKI